MRVATPGDRDDGYRDGDDNPLTGADATKYRGIVARGNYLSQGRTDIQFAVKELSRRMSKPTEDHFEALRRLCRYLLGKLGDI